MSVFILTFRHASTRFPESAKTVGVFATKDLVLARVDKARKDFQAQGSGYLVQENNDGITCYHEMGSMSFVPAVYSYEEHSVVEA
jgi:hypothetical protein